jgi:hypothetical protein
MSDSNTHDLQQGETSVSDIWACLQEEQIG